MTGKVHAHFTFSRLRRPLFCVIFVLIVFGHRGQVHATSTLRFCSTLTRCTLRVLSHLHSPRVFSLHVPHFLRQFCFVTQCKRTCNFPLLLFRLYVTSFSDPALWEALPKVSNLRCPFFDNASCANPVDMFVGFLDCSLCTDLLSVPVFQISPLGFCQVLTVRNSFRPIILSYFKTFRTIIAIL